MRESQDNNTMKASSDVSQYNASTFTPCAVLQKDNIKPVTCRNDAQHHTSPSMSKLPNPLKEVSSSVTSVNTSTRKRNIDNVCTDVAMSSYNSAFLSGLFADIAKANTDNKTPFQIERKAEGSHACKKSRVSLSKSLSRCGESFANLNYAVGVSAATFSIGRTRTCKSNSFSPRGTPNKHWIHHVSSDSSTDEDSIQPASNMRRLFFPHLPPTVSDSSCSRYSAGANKTDSRHQSLLVTNHDSKESYGWFVNTDDCETNFRPVDASSNKERYSDLAFSAITAPKRQNHDAEVEWAKAADTVDDVLGDFF